MLIVFGILVKGNLVSFVFEGGLCGGGRGGRKGGERSFREGWGGFVGMLVVGELVG